MIRTITYSEFLSNTAKLFNRLSILKMKDIIAYKCFLLLFKAFHNLLPVTLNSNFVVKCSPYQYATRSTNTFIGIICKSNTILNTQLLSTNSSTGLIFFSVITVAINLLNTLPNTVKMMSSYMSFKNISSLYF